MKVFSTSTEECIHNLRGHTDLVTGVLIRPSNHLQVGVDITVQLQPTLRFTEEMPEERLALKLLNSFSRVGGLQLRMVGISV